MLLWWEDRTMSKKFASHGPICPPHIIKTLCEKSIRSWIAGTPGFWIQVDLTLIRIKKTRIRILIHFLKETDSNTDQSLEKIQIWNLSWNFKYLSYLGQYQTLIFYFFKTVLLRRQAGIWNLNWNLYLSYLRQYQTVILFFLSSVFMVRRQGLCHKFLRRVVQYAPPPI